MSNNMHKRCAEIMAELGKNGEFEFWEEFQWLPKVKLEKRLKDILEDDVEEKYYLSDKMIKGLSPCLTTMEGGNRQPKIQIDNPLKGKTKYGWHFEQNVYSKNSICTRTIMAGEGSGSRAKVIEDYRIRKLTPRECFRLQDFDDTFKFVVSNSQLYKQAGNSISVNISEMVFRQIELSRDGNLDKNSLF